MLKRKIVRGSLVLVLLRLSIRLLGLISTMILFRILVPDDFGLVSLAATVVGLVDVAIDFGFETTLIQKQNPSRSDYDATWTLNLLRGIGCALLLLFMAEPVATYFHEPRLGPMIQWLSLAPLLDGLRNVGVIQFNRELQFNTEFALRLSQKLVSFTLTLFCAYWLRNYWALVVGILVGKVAGLLLSFALHAFRPRFSLVGWRQIFHFSAWIMSNNAVLYAGNQTDKLVLQKYFDAHMVGIYRVAEEMCNVVLELIVPVEQALYAGYAKLADNVPELRRIMLNSLGLVALVAIPVSIGMMLVSEPLLAILFGPNSAGAGAFMQVLVLYGAIRACQSGVSPVFMAMGHPELETRLTIISVAIRLTVLFTAFPILGAMAAPWSLVAGSAAGFLMVWHQARTFVQFRWRDFPLAIWRPIVGAAVMALFLPWMEALLFGADWDPNDWIQIGFRVSAGMVSYSASVLACWWLAGKPEGAETALLNHIRNWYAESPRATS